MFNVAQTTAGQTITLPSPTNVKAGRIVYICNTGTVPFNTYGSAGTVANGACRIVTWMGSSWGSTSDTLAAINPQTTSYILAISDNNRFITMDSASAMALTLPLYSSIAIPIGFQCTVAQKNTGTVTISPASGVTVISTATTRAFKAKGSAATLIKTGTDEWMLFGDMN